MGRPLALVDSQLLTLWIVGSVAPNDIDTNKRTRKYDLKSFALLASMLQSYRGIVTTPNVLTEASNLVCSAFTGVHLQTALALLAREVSLWTERFVESEQVVKRPEYMRLGLTDAALLMLTRQDIELVTDDLELFLAASEKLLPVKYFTYLRTTGWLD